VIFLAVLLESDDGAWRADNLVAELQAELFPKLVGYKTLGMSRTQILGHLQHDMFVQVHRSCGHDDWIGGLAEIRLTQSDLETARQGWPQVFKRITFSDIGTDPAWYYVTFVLQQTSIIIF
jgi:hypothetical protein